MVMKAQSTTKSKLQAVFSFSVDGGICSASGSKKKGSQYTGNTVVGEVSKTGFTPFQSPLYSTKGKFYKSYIKEN